MSQTSEQEKQTQEQERRPVTVHVNTKPVLLPRRLVTGLAIKEEAIAQGVEIELDFILTLEAHGHKPAETIDDEQTVTVTEHSQFTANDGDDDS
jgi:hypothetical protein